MKLTTLASVLVGTLAVGATAAAEPAPKGPDFTSTHIPARGVDRELAASNASGAIEPTDVVPFALDSSWLAPVEMAPVDAAAHWLEKHPTYRVMLEGHTDRSGTADHNVDLSLRRAEAVGARLIGDGISADRVILVVYGKHGASTRIDGNDRRVVMSATKLSVQDIVRGSLAHDAIAVTWRERGAVFTLQEGLLPEGLRARESTIGEERRRPIDRLPSGLRAPQLTALR